ncbi:hypothetical protein BD626DRAFT_552286 [Schizophyllum amplum]|uniref:GATA-type domain-containing protein n=1 Tax=Schizophyllum amplum TaxID=97359 RepID=A0A550BSN2_9AGAR|nr:hypothetical protein BD626DRAFT_552286 [Auriculariopsis ampla]
MSSSLCTSCGTAVFPTHIHGHFFAEMWARPAPLSRVDESSVRAKIAELQNDIRARDIQIVRIIDEKATLEDYVQRASALFAPIRRVPAEILKSIFQLLLPAGVRTFPAVFVPALVCRSWRSVVTGEPLVYHDTRQQASPSPQPDAMMRTPAASPLLDGPPFGASRPIVSSSSHQDLPPRLSRAASPLSLHSLDHCHSQETFQAVTSLLSLSRQSSYYTCEQSDAETVDTPRGAAKDPTPSRSSSPQDCAKAECANCGATHTPLWRRGLNDELNCNACGLYYKQHRPAPSSSVKQEAEPPVGVICDAQCHNCQTTVTPLWRKDPTAAPCGLYFKLHGSPRPISGSSDVIRRRSRYGSRPQQQQTPSASPPSVRIAPAVSIPRAVSKTAGKADRPTKRRKLGEMETSSSRSLLLHLLTVDFITYLLSPCVHNAGHDRLLAWVLVPGRPGAVAYF